MTGLTENRVREAFDKVRYDVPVSKIVAGAKRRRHRRRLAMGALPALGLLAAGGYAMAQREINDPAVLGCSSQFDQLSDMTVIGRVEGESPIETCIRVMSQSRAWPSPPANPVECVTNYPNGDGGALVVFPAPAEMTQEDACSSLGAALPPEEHP